MVTDSLNTCSENIDSYFLNCNNQFKNKESLNSLKEIQNMLLLYNYINYYKNTQSDPESDSRSESES